MKKAVLYIFSGTGNTAKASSLYQKFLDHHETTVWRITMAGGVFATFPDPADFDLVGVGYPVHAFNAPQVVEDFCRQLPAAGGKDAFIFKTSGEGLHLNDASSDRIIRILQKKGYTVKSERHIVLPHNIMFRHPAELVQVEWAYAQSQVALHCRAILSGNDERPPSHHLSGWFTAMLRIEWLYARIQGSFMRVQQSKCIKCLKCVKICPLGNIKFDGNNKFTFGTNCAMCQGCVLNCPKNAITIGLLNRCKLNGSYNLGENSGSSIKNRDDALQYLEDLRGFKKMLFRPHFIALDKALEAAGLSPAF